MTGWKNICHANGNQKNDGTAILLSYLKLKKITKYKEVHYRVMKGSVQDEDIAIVNIYAPNIGAPLYVRQTLRDIKRETEVKEQ